MTLTDTIHVGERKIELHSGDLLSRDPAHTSEVLVVSAFPDDYAPTDRSLVGAMHRAGFPLQDIARDKEVDMRAVSSCWISRSLSTMWPDFGYQRVLCFEPLEPSSAPEIVGDIFRALVPYLGPGGFRSVSMSLVGAGDQGNDPMIMLRSIVEAGVQWMSQEAISLETLRIVVRPSSAFEQLRQSFGRLKSSLPKQSVKQEKEFDVFISYSRQNVTEAEAFIEALREVTPDVRVFMDRLSLEPGRAWQTQLAEALGQSGKVAALLSDAYVTSRICLEEYNIAWMHGLETEAEFLHPIYLYSAQLPMHMRYVQYVDCREGSLDKLRATAAGLGESIKEN